MKGKFIPFETIDNQYMVSLDDTLCLNVLQKATLSNIGSYNVFPARLLGLEYADYLRFARDKYNGKLYGKNHKYPTIRFNSRAECNSLCQFLNKRLSLI